MQNNHDQSHGYQFNGSVKAQSIGGTHYYGDKSRQVEVKLNVIQESLKTINKEELKQKAKTGRKIQLVFIALLCIEFLIFVAVVIFLVRQRILL